MHEHRSSNLTYHLTRIVLNLVLRVVYRRVSCGVSNVPRTGPVLLVANHQSNLDPPLIAGQIHWRRLEYMAKAELFKSSWFGRFIGGLGAVPVKSDGGSNTAVIRTMLRRLNEGAAVLVFPEGARTEDGAMQPFQLGVALLIKRSKCPVVPVAVEGCFQAWPRSHRRPVLRGVRVGVSFGEPISHEALMADGAEAALDRLADAVDTLRLDLRARLRRRTRGRFPPSGPGDGSRLQQPAQPGRRREQDD